MGPKQNSSLPLTRAAAIEGTSAENARLTAKADGPLAELMLALAFEQDVKVRQDPALMEILSTLEEGSPIPAQALSIISEILARVYAASLVEGSAP
ncbi:MAG: flagellar protein FhlB [Pseudomonadota bacterium]